MNEKSRKTIASGQPDWAKESESETESKSLMKSQMEVQMMKPVAQMAQILTGSVPRALHKLAYIDALCHCRLRLHFALTVISGLFFNSSSLLLLFPVNFDSDFGRFCRFADSVTCRPRRRWNAPPPPSLLKRKFCRKRRTHTHLHTRTQIDTQTVLYTVCLIRFFVHVRETITTKPQQLRMARVIKQTINELQNICGNISSDIVKRPAKQLQLQSTHTHTHTRHNNVKTFVGQGVGSSTNQLRPSVRPFVCPPIRSSCWGLLSLLSFKSSKTTGKTAAAASTGQAHNYSWHWRGSNEMEVDAQSRGDTPSWREGGEAAGLSNTTNEITKLHFTKLKQKNWRGFCCDAMQSCFSAWRHWTWKERDGERQRGSMRERDRARKIETREKGGRDAYVYNEMPFWHRLNFIFDLWFDNFFLCICFFLFVAKNVNKFVA